MTDLLSRSLKHPVLILDCQTTGASPAYGSLLELGWANGDADACAEVVSLPEDVQIPHRIKRMTGVTDQELIAARQPGEVWSDILKQAGVGGATSTHNVPVVIHYARFEKPWLDQLSVADEEMVLPEPICTYEVARRLLPGLPSRSIRAIAGYLGQPMDELKRARHHVEATRFIWRELVTRLEAISITTFGELQAWMAATKPQKPNKTTYALPVETRLKLPDCPGVYLFKGADGRILYIGKATSLKSRVNSYFRGRKTKGSRLNELRAQIQDVETRPVDSPLAAALLETDLIKQNDPPYNRALRQGERSLLYCDSLLTPSMTPLPRSLGPVGQTGTLLQLNALLNIADAQPWQLDAFGIDSDVAQLIVHEALAIFNQQSDFPLMRDADNLRGMFAQALVSSIRRDKERLQLALEAEDAEEVMVAEELESEEKDEPEPLIMTPEIFASMIRGNIYGLARHLFRVRWMKRLVNCDLFWSDAKGRCHHMQMRGAIPRFEMGTEPPAAAEAGTAGPVASDVLTDVVVFDRLGVLYTEILRLLKSEADVVLRPVGGRLLAADALKRLMYPGYFL